MAKLINNFCYNNDKNHIIFKIIIKIIKKDNQSYFLTPLAACPGSQGSFSFGFLIKITSFQNGFLLAESLDVSPEIFRNVFQLPDQ